MLSDKEIRVGFLQHLEKSRKKPKAVIEELSICNGASRADIVALYDFPHSFEIKSDIDRLDRLPSQVAFYDFTFKKNTVITTERFINKVLAIVPVHWGVTLAFAKQDTEIRFKHVKKPTVNKNWAGDKALLTLWKQELIKLSDCLLSNNVPKSLSREHIAQILHSETRKNELQKAFFSQLEYRYTTGVDAVTSSFSL